MNKRELIRTLSRESGLRTEDATEMVNMFFETIKGALLDSHRVEIRGFGTFKLKDYDGYVGRNPKTGVSVEVKEKRLPVFRGGKQLRDFINS